MRTESLSWSNSEIGQTATERQSLIGMQPSTIGSDLTEPATMLIDGNARQVDREIVKSLPPSLSCLIKPKVSREYDLIGYEIDKSATSKDLNAIKEQIEVAHADGGMSEETKRGYIIKHLTWLYTVTSHREHHATDLTMMLSAYTEELINYPIITIPTAIRAVQKKSKWFPSLHELTEELDYLNLHRSELLKAVSTALPVHNLVKQALHGKD